MEQLLPQTAKDHFWKFVQIPKSDYIFVGLKGGGRLAVSLWLLRTDTDPLRNLSMLLLFKLAFVRLSLLK